jgi:hypothetical protein
VHDDEELLTGKPASRGSQRLAWWIAGAMTGWLLLALLTGSVLVGLFCDLASGALVAGVAVARRIDGPFRATGRRSAGTRPAWSTARGSA